MLKFFNKIRRNIIGFNKKDMFISENFTDKKISRITDTFSGLKVPSLDLNLLKDIYIKDISNKGVFVYTPKDYSWSQFKFKDTFYKETEMWYDQSSVFKRLRNISYNLGYTIGTSVYTNNGGFGVISKIVNFAFYDNISECCSESLTLLYKVGEIYYQITQIEKSNEKNDNIIDEVIKENFYELLDDNIISYSSVDEKYRFKCKLVIHKFSTNTLNQVTECLSVAHNRLSDTKMKLEVEDIYKSNGEYNIEFKCFKFK